MSMVALAWVSGVVSLEGFWERPPLRFANEFIFMHRELEEELIRTDG